MNVRWPEPSGKVPTRFPSIQNLKLNEEKIEIPEKKSEQIPDIFSVFSASLSPLKISENTDILKIRSMFAEIWSEPLKDSKD